MYKKNRIHPSSTNFLPEKKGKITGSRGGSSPISIAEGKSEDDEIHKNKLVGGSGIFTASIF
jgi:hypothetical protein